MDKIESKRLIATFMNYAGGKPLTDSLLSSLYSDWNDIMPVLQKITNLGYYINMNYGALEGNIKKHWADADYLVRVGSVPNKYVSNPPTAEHPMFVGEFDDPIQAIYNLVVRFIQWYNEQK